jgi:hypothetical protein
MFSGHMSWATDRFFFNGVSEGGRVGRIAGTLEMGILTEMIAGIILVPRNTLPPEEAGTTICQVIPTVLISGNN